MHFIVSQLMSEASGSTRTFELDEVLLPSDETGTQRVRGTVRLLRTDKGIRVSAQLDTEAPSTCSRCLSDFNHPLHMSMEEEFFSSAELMSGHRADAAEDAEGNFYVGEDHTLDLTEATRQYFALSVPMKPVCRKDCAGICLNCGADLNVSACDCVTDRRDVRWGALLDLVTSSSPPAKGAG
jgi:uncharacterized protein